jgi:hypothetical protein
MARRQRLHIEGMRDPVDVLARRWQWRCSPPHHGGTPLVPADRGSGPAWPRWASPDLGPPLFLHVSAWLISTLADRHYGDIGGRSGTHHRGFGGVVGAL